MSLNGYTIGVIIPAYNEEEYIGSTIKSLKTLDYIDEILVVDDGSVDKTDLISRYNGAKVLSLAENMGKAYSMQKGCHASKTDVITFLDADIGETAKEASKLIKPLCFNEAEVTIARFPMTPKKGGFGFVKGLSQWGLKILTGKTLSSVLSGQRGFMKSVISGNDFSKYRGFGVEFGMTVDLIKNNIKIKEVNVDMSHRTTGRDLRGFLHRLNQFIDISKVILKKLSNKEA